MAAMREGDAHFRASDHAAAARAFARALDLLAGRVTELTVDVYLRLGRANEALGRVGACMHCFKKGLEADPEHAPTLRALATLHLEWHEHEAADAVEERLFACAGSEHECAIELIRSGDRWWKRADDPERAKRRYRRALCVEPGEMAGPEQQRVVARLRAIRSKS